MSASRTAKSRWWSPVIVGIIASAWLIAVAIRREFSGVISDGFIYLLMADGFSFFGRSADSVTLDFLFAHYAFPPLFPLLLAVTGAGLRNPQWTFALNACVLGVAIAMLLRVYQGIGIPKVCAVTLAMTVAIMPITWLTAMDVQSEPLYLLLTMGCLGCLNGTPTSRAWFVGGLCCGLAVITRTIGVSLLAVFLFSWWQRGRRVGITPIVLAFTPIIAWTAFRGFFNYNASYVDAKHRFLRGSFDHLIKVIETNLQSFASHGVKSFHFEGPAYTEIVLAGFALLALTELVRRLIRGQADALYIACYVALILCWPYPDHQRRFLFMILPLLMGYATNLTYCIAREYGSVRIAYAAPLSVIVIFALLSLPCTAQMLVARFALESPELRKIAQSPGSYLINSLETARVAARYSAQVFDLARRGRDLVPREACVSSTLPDHVMFYARRPAIDLKLSLGDAALRTGQLKDCPYVFMVAMKTHPPDRTALMYPFTLLRSQLEVLAVVRAEPGNLKSPVNAMWARYRVPKNP